MRTHHRWLVTARAEALFASTVPTGMLLSRAQLDATVATTVRRHGGVRQCAAAMATEFGDHPEAAVHRMRWALRAAAHR
ncbi:hypothetical protein [Actinoplanes flavus]|uniref:Uncharacterized protein n=1 Tax=Actinoplanes flavus TaxID=2820290 RepID=A0ABS3UUI3_9ACTN|nr:hypothetical protein [Actinoplanes flavus]MBO3742250.1 hypothetical protein [Actinoplanes flavus]